MSQIVMPWAVPQTKATKICRGLKEDEDWLPSLCQWAFEEATGNKVVVEDVAADPRFSFHYIFLYFHPTFHCCSPVCPPLCVGGLDACCGRYTCHLQQIDLCRSKELLELMLKGI